MYISIRETNYNQRLFSAEIQIDNNQSYPVVIINPFSIEEEKRLERYFESWWQLPVVDKVWAKQVTTSIKTYGEHIFEQLCQAHPAVRMLLQQASSPSVTIAGSPAFHALHWETLKNPNQPHPFAILGTFIRTSDNTYPHAIQSLPARQLNILLVVARLGRKDVAYRTISRPLVEAIETDSIPAQIYIVRPGTYTALVAHLKKRGVGYYHIVHFDLHGALLTYEQYLGRQDPSQNQDSVSFFEGQKAFLFFDQVSRAPHLVADGEISALMQAYQVPIVMLNACQSGKQAGLQETSLGSRLMQAGVQQVVAMSQSVLVPTAKALMKCYSSDGNGHGLQLERE